MLELKAALKIYRENIYQILILSFTIMLPIQMLLILSSNYFYFNLGMLDLLFIADLINGIFVLISVSVISLPFIQLAKNTYLDEQLSLSSAFDTLMRYMFPVYVISVFYAIGVALGMFALIIPGILISVLFFAFPFVFVIEEETWKKSIQRSFEFGKSHFTFLILVFLLFGLLEWFMLMSTTLVTNLITSSYVIIVGINFLVSILYYPLFYFFVAIKYIEWAGMNVSN
ncbi:hypothetical protein GXN76_00945 [Kroppenstedtia pulmonis]|uniref:DUF975 family protein n=1 Tax=Kroppenstedtia pulmonis TaxID=1380685 RepID=A0A7D4B0M3_9BACL|nr:hypothetical protein [Kroppenstedtia pulmonis]QKG83166.1 hypothetical protein GXN76_00945 [Kroppenstedtia pulmonis]